MIPMYKWDTPVNVDLTKVQPLTKWDDPSKRGLFNHQKSGSKPSQNNGDRQFVNIDYMISICLEAGIIWTSFFELLK